MADRRLNVIITARDAASAKMKSFAKNTNTAMKGAQRSLENFSSSAKKAGAALTAMGAGLGLLTKKFVDAAGAQEFAEKRLETLAKNAAGATDAQVQALKDQAAALQQVGVVGDEVIQIGQGQLATFALQSSAIEQLTPAMLDMAVATKGVNVTQEDLINIGNLVGKVMGGQVGALSRLGVTFNEAQEEVLKFGTAEEKAATLAEVLAQNFGGLNEAARETGEGAIKALRNNLGDVMEIMGGPVLDAIGAVANKLSFFLVRLQNSNPTLLRMAGIAIAVAAAIASIAGPLLLIVGFLPSITAGFAALGITMSAVLGPITLIVAGMAALFIAWETNFLGIQEVTGQAMEFIVPLITDGFNFIRDTVVSVVTTILEFWRSIEPEVIATWEAIQPVVEVALELLKETIMIGFEAIKLFITLTWNRIKFIIKTAWAAIKLLIKVGLALIRGDWVTAWNAIKQFFAEFWANLKEFVKAQIDAVIEFFRAGWAIVVGIFEKFGVDVTAIWNGLWEGIRQVADTAANFIIDIVQRLVGIIGSAIEGLKNLLGLASSGIKTAASFAAETAKNTFNQVKSDFGFRKGGRVVGGRRVIVGEDGPEEFRPDSSGQVLPTSRSGLGGSTITVNVSGNTLLDEESGEKIGDMIAQQLQLQERLI